MQSEKLQIAKGASRTQMKIEVCFFGSRILSRTRRYNSCENEVEGRQL